MQGTTYIKRPLQAILMSVYSFPLMPKKHLNPLMYLPLSGATAAGTFTVTLWISCVHAAAYPCKLVLMDLREQRKPSTLVAAAAASDFVKQPTHLGLDSL